MAELPTNRPTDSFSWPATTNGTSEPSSGLRNAGWAPGDAPPAEEFNWWWQKLGQNLDWLRALAVRRFQTMPEAIAATAEGDLCMIDHPWQAIHEAADVIIGNNGGVPFTPLLVACDGRRLYIASNAATGRLAAYEATPAATAVALWSLSGLEIDPIDISTDGEVVAVTNGITGSPAPKNIIIYDAATGGVLYTDASTGYCYACVCAGRDGAGNRRVYWGTAPGTGSAFIYRWSGASRITEESGLNDIRALAFGGEVLVAAYSPDGTKVGFRAWGLADGGGRSFICEATATANPSRAQGLACDGERIYWLVTGVGGGEDHRVFCYSVASGGVLLWTATLGDVNVGFNRLHVDDRYVYATWFASGDTVVAILDKRTGGVVSLINPNDSLAPLANGRAFAVDGSRVWVCFDGESVIGARGTSRQPTLWRRRGIQGRQMMPASLLMQPVGGTR